MTILVSLLGFGLVGSATAGAHKTFSLVTGSGGQTHIGGGLALPIQAAAPASVTGTVFPPLLIPAVASTVMGTTGPGLAVTVAPGALFKAATQATVGVFTSNPTLYAVATNLSFSWPAGVATFSVSGGPRNTLGDPITFAAAGVGAGATIRYSERVIGKRFGGAAVFSIGAGPAAGKIPGAPVTIYAIAVPTAGAGNPPCHHPAFNTTAGNGGIWPPPGNPACVAALIEARPTGLGVGGGVPFGTVMTTPMNPIPGIFIGAFGTGILRPAGPAGSVSFATATPNSNPGPTNMAFSSGFPLTTGMITVSATSAMGAAEKFVLSGGDTRSVGGNGVLQMVSGALSARPLSGANANRQWIRLILADLPGPPPVPTMSPLMQAVTVGLIIVLTTAGGYAVRTRRNSA